MTRISTVLFDLGGVLFRFNPDRRLQLMSSVSGISETILHARLWASGFSDECDAGRYTAQGMYRKACDLLDWHPEYLLFRDLWASAFELDEAVFAAAKRIRPAVQTGILTNNPEILREKLTEQFGQFKKPFKPIVFSATHKVLKPEEGIFLKAAAEAGSPVDQVLFIDDSQKHVDGARKVGMKAIHFTAVEELVSLLARHDVLS